MQQVGNRKGETCAYHHNTAHGDERSGGKAPFLGTEQASHGDISPSSKLAISLDNNTTTQVVQNKRLVGLGETELPGETSVLDASPSGSASATIVARDQDVVSFGFCNTSGDNADASF